MDLGYFETGLPVKDIAASLAFYEALGFQRVDGSVAARSLTLARGDCRLGLYQGHLDPDKVQLIFWQGDVEAIAGEAGRRGLGFRVPLKRDDNGVAFMLEDPDGNPLFVIHEQVFFRGEPGLAHPAPAERPQAAVDPALGWFEISLEVADIDRAVAFYETLGFQVVVRETKGTRVSVQNGDCRVGLFKGHLQPPRPQLIFWQGDIDALAQTVTGHGLGFVNPPRRDASGAAFMIEDPDGHPLFFINMRGVARQQPDPTAVAAG